MAATEFAQELEAALQAAGLAGSRILADYESFQAIPDAPVSITTDTDRASQEIILRRLSDQFPADAYVAEETTPTVAGLTRWGERTWIVDPIDGTRGFAQKNGEFSVMIALAVGGRPVVGVVLEPTLGRVTFASRKAGCWVCEKGGEPRRCHGGLSRDPERATLVLSRGRNTGAEHPIAVAVKPARTLRTHSAGVKLALVARGEADLYVNTYPRFHDWDIAAGVILVEEAGGRCGNLDGSPLAFCNDEYSQTGGLIASNSALFPAAVERCRGLEMGKGY